MASKSASLSKEEREMEKKLNEEEQTICIVCREKYSGKTYAKYHCQKCCSDLRAIRRAFGECETAEDGEQDQDSSAQPQLPIHF